MQLNKQTSKTVADLTIGGLSAAVIANMLTGKEPRMYPEDEGKFGIDHPEIVRMRSLCLDLIPDEVYKEHHWLIKGESLLALMVSDQNELVAGFIDSKTCQLIHPGPDLLAVVKIENLSPNAYIMFCWLWEEVLKSCGGIRPFAESIFIACCFHILAQRSLLNEAIDFPNLTEQQTHTYHKLIDQVLWQMELYTLNNAKPNPKQPIDFNLNRLKVGMDTKDLFAMFYGEKPAPFENEPESQLYKQQLGLPQDRMAFLAIPCKDDEVAKTVCREPHTAIMFVLDGNKGVYATLIQRKDENADKLETIAPPIKLMTPPKNINEYFNYINGMVSLRHPDKELNQTFPLIHLTMMLYLQHPSRHRAIAGFSDEQLVAYVNSKVVRCEEFADLTSPEHLALLKLCEQAYVTFWDMKINYGELERQLFKRSSKTCAVCPANMQFKDLDQLLELVNLPVDNKVALKQTGLPKMTRMQFAVDAKGNLIAMLVNVMDDVLMERGYYSESIVVKTSSPAMHRFLMALTNLLHSLDDDHLDSLHQVEEHHFDIALMLHCLKNWDYLASKAEQSDTAQIEACKILFPPYGFTLPFDQLYQHQEVA